LGMKVMPRSAKALSNAREEAGEGPYSAKSCSLITHPASHSKLSRQPNLLLK
jgi:hypothetical protein